MTSSMPNEHIQTLIVDDQEEQRLATRANCEVLFNNIKENDYKLNRITGKNHQKAKEFIQQLASIRNFNGFEIYSKLASMSIEISILSGEEDQLFAKEHISDIVKLLPQARHISLKETGHMLHLENLNGLVEAFVSNNLL